MKEFRPSAPSAEAVFYRTYSRRKSDGTRENFNEAMSRTINDIAEIGKFTTEQKALVMQEALAQRAFPSGRAFWVAGTEWGKKPENFSGYYNCTSTHVHDIQAFGLMVDLAMQGSGTGAVLEKDVIDKLPAITRKLVIRNVTGIGKAPGEPDTKCVWDDEGIHIQVGDSRKGWKDAYMAIIHQATSTIETRKPICEVYLNLEQVRPAGERLKGFGGTANPVKLEEMFRKVVDLLNTAVGRKLTTVEACLLIDEAAACIVAGNIRRSAGMRQFSQNDEEAATAKLGLYTQDEEGNWKVDPKKEALRMANHTRCYHTKPSLQEVTDAVTKQFHSGEGAIQYVPEAVARANADVLNNKKLRKKFVQEYVNQGRQKAQEFLFRTAYLNHGTELDHRELDHRMDRYGLNPCGEIIGRDFHCNLAEVHLNTIDPGDKKQQENAFYAAGLQVAALLQHEFVHERYQYSREIDPIVGVSFTGLFDFFVHAFGSEWLEWMMEGRPDDGRRASVFRASEQLYLARWRTAARKAVIHYCGQNNIRLPNRITTVQPAGTKSLLTGASSGWHPPKAQRFIRRITLGVSDPLVPALMEYGFSVIPAQSARDDEGNLLDDIRDPRVQEVLVEIPTEVSWANLPGCDEFNLADLPVEAQYGLYMQVQEHYTDHNTSATIELREHEIDTLSELIYETIQEDGGYISAALLARFDANETFPRLPFEPISKEKYDSLVEINQVSRVSDDFLKILNEYDNEDWSIESVAGCQSAACLDKAEKDSREKGV
jgi:ribonucleotide reductase, class II